jgi:diguanylate cyclase (GGDEF)-like protein
MTKILLNNKHIHIISLVTTIILIIIVYYFKIQYPTIIMLTLIVYFTFLGGLLSGTISGLLTMIYSVVYFSKPDKLFSYSPDNFQNLIMSIIFIPIIVFIIGNLKEQFTKQTMKLEALNHELSMISMKDSLTGLFNRRYFDEFIRVEWIHAFRERTPISFIFIDIDYFKAFNDTYGHLNGDDCLIGVASAMAESDKRAGDLVARYGGDEFAIVLPNTDLIGAHLVAEKIVQAVKNLQIRHVSSAINQYVTVSAGVTTMIPMEGKNYFDLIKKADEVLYQAKENGRNRVEISKEVKKKESKFPSFA